jgi:valyl-tRNA synthetase
MNILLAPFMPHLAEHFHKELYPTSTSIHLEYVDINDRVYVDSTIINSVYSLSEVFENVRNLRVKLNFPILYPLDNISIYTENVGLLSYEDVIKKELNIKSLNLQSLSNLKTLYKPNKGVLGRLFKARAAEMAKSIEEGRLEGVPEECYSLEYVLEDLDGFISTKFDYYVDEQRKEGVIYLSNGLTEGNKLEAEANHILRQVNILRKEKGFKLYDKVYIELLDNPVLQKMDKELIYHIKTQLGGNMIITDTLEKEFSTFKSIDGSTDICLTIEKVTV